jgi:hypothetical protein
MPIEQSRNQLISKSITSYFRYQTQSTHKNSANTPANCSKLDHRISQIAPASPSLMGKLDFQQFTGYENLLPNETGDALAFGNSIDGVSWGDRGTTAHT